MKVNKLLWSLLLISIIGCSNSIIPDDTDGVITDEPDSTIIDNSDNDMSDDSNNDSNDESTTEQNNWTPVKFAVISDIHFGNDVAEGPMVKVPKALKNITSHGELDALIVVGDLTDHGNEDEYQLLVQTFKDSTMFTNPVGNFFFMMGNHDNYNSNGIANYQEGLKEFNNGEPYPLFNYQVVNGYPFITVSMQNGHNNDLDNLKIGSMAYPAETLKWLEQSLEKASVECPERPIFVFTHVPPRWTCYSTWPEYENGVAWCMQVLNPVLNKYPQAVVFSGHSHYPLKDPRSIHQGAHPYSTRQNYFTVINTSSTTYAEIHPDAVDEGIHPTQFGYVTEGLIVNALSNGNVEIRRYDTYRNEEIAADKPWVLKAPHDGSQFTYADIRDANDNPLNKVLYSGGASPVFDDNAELTLGIAATSVKVTFPQASDDDCVFRYIVNVYDTESGVSVSKASIFSRFYLNSEMPDKFTQIMDGLQSGKDYRVEVVAYDSYDNESAPLAKSFTTR